MQPQSPYPSGAVSVNSPALSAKRPTGSVEGAFAYRLTDARSRDHWEYYQPEDLDNWAYLILTIEGLAINCTCESHKYGLIRDTDHVCKHMEAITASITDSLNALEALSMAQEGPRKRQEVAHV